MKQQFVHAAWQYSWCQYEIGAIQTCISNKKKKLQHQRFQLSNDEL